MTLVRSACSALPALPESSFSHGQPRVIAFKHPGYSDYAKQNELLSLCATDSITGGIHYGTAWTACALVAGNASNGYMTREREGARIILKDDELLTDESLTRLRFVRAELACCWLDYDSPPSNGKEPLSSLEPARYTSGTFRGH